MDEEQEKKANQIRAFEDHLWNKTCPVMVETSSLIENVEEGVLLLLCQFRAVIRGEKIQSVAIEVSCYDENKEVVEKQMYCYQGLDIDFQETFGEKAEIPIQNNSTTSYSIVVETVTYESGIEQKVHTQLKALKPPRPLSEMYAMKKYFIKNIQKKCRKAIIMNLPTDYGSYWYCTCSAVNKGDEKECIRCGINKKQQMQLADLDYLERVLYPMTIWKRVIAVFIMIAIIVGALVGGQDVYNYQAAGYYYRHEQYSKAIQLYQQNTAFLDSDMKLQECYAASALKALGEKDYGGAIIYANQIKHRIETYDLRARCFYQLALVKYEEKDYEKAITLLEPYTGYPNVSALVNICKHELGE